MFTIKFFTDQDHYQVLECPNYNINTFKTAEGSVTEVTLYKDFTTQQGVTYRVADSLEVPHWKYAFIENSSGKTIDHIRH